MYVYIYIYIYIYTYIYIYLYIKLQKFVNLKLHIVHPHACHSKTLILI